MKLNILIIIISVSVFFSYANFSSLYVSDELDYLDAIDAGFTENYLETQSISSYDFFIQTISAFVKGTEINIWQKMHKQHDVMSSRHFHGPFAFYNYTVFQTLFPQTSLRYVSFSWSILLTCLILLAINQCNPLIKTLTILNFIPYLLNSSQLTAIGPHLIYTCIALLTLLSLKQYLLSNKNHYWYLTCFFSAIALTTLEYALFLLITVFAIIYFKRKSLQDFSFSLLLKGLLLLLTSLALIWPAGLLKLKILVSYAKYTYVALFSDYYRSFSDALIFNSISHLLILIVTLPAVLIFFCKKHFWQDCSLQVFIAYGLALFCLNLPNHFIYPQYIFSFAGFLLIASAIIFSRSLPLNLPYKISITTLLIISSCLSFYDMRQSLTEKAGIEQIQRDNIVNISQELKDLTDITFVGYANYVSKRSLNWSGNISVLDPDISSVSQFLSHINEQKINGLIYFKNTPRVFKQISVSDLKQSINDNFTLSYSGSDYEIYSRKD